MCCMEIFLQSCEWNLTTTKKSEKNRKHLKIPGINFFFCDKASGGVHKKILKSADYSYHHPIKCHFSWNWFTEKKFHCFKQIKQRRRKINYNITTAKTTKWLKTLAPNSQIIMNSRKSLESKLLFSFLYIIFYIFLRIIIIYYCFLVA